VAKAPDERGPTAVNTERTEAWWWVRLELQVGIGMTVLAAFLLLIQPPFYVNAPVTIGPLEVSASEGVLVLAAILAGTGLIWMIRIFRGHIDEPPAWRYRR
jgi:hypothetical protein